MGLFFTIPAAVAFLIVPFELIQVLFERNRFTSEDTLNTAYALGAYAAGLPAYVLAKVFSPGYFARKDTKTPLKFAMVALVVNVSLNLALMGPFGHVGLAMATAISAWLNVALLCTGLIRRGHYAPDKTMLGRLWRYVLCSVLMGAAVWFLAKMVSPMMAGVFSEQVMAIGILIAGGMTSYFVLVFLLGAVKKDDLKAAFKRS